LKVRPLTQRTHVDFHTVQAAVFGELERAGLLSLEHHPVGGGDFVTLRRGGRSGLRKSRARQDRRRNRGAAARKKRSSTDHCGACCTLARALMSICATV